MSWRARRPEVAAVLGLLPMVTWDRFTVEQDDERMQVYGWIPRDDGRADFVLLDLSVPAEGDLLVGYTTSSAAHSDEIGRLLHGEGPRVHNPCQRVEDHFTGIRVATRS